MRNAEATKKPRLTAKQKRMQKAIKYMTDYMADYGCQLGALDYSDRMFIDDVLYGLGVALHGTKVSYAQGFDAWRAMLSEHLKDKA